MSIDPSLKSKDLNSQCLQDFLAKHIPDFGSQMTLRPFSFGQSNPTFLISTLSGQWVLRKKPKGKLLSKTAHAVEREFRIIKALYSHTNFPVPKPILLCEDMKVLDTPFYVMEYVKGNTYTDILGEFFPKEIRMSSWRQAVKALAQLHSINLKEVGLENYGKVSHFYSRQIHTLGKVLQAQAQARDDSGDILGEVPGGDLIMHWLQSHLIADECSIVHGDYKLDNMIFSKDGENRLLAVIDWELSTLGHPLSDLANLLMPYYLPSNSNNPLTGFQGLDLKQLGLPNVEDLLQDYCRCRERAYPIPGWDFCIAFSFFRLIVILHGINARLILGQASSSQAKLYSTLWRPLTTICLDFMQKSTLPNSKL